MTRTPGNLARVGVVGCGNMGSGVAQLCARHGFLVTMSELDAERLEAGAARITANLATELQNGSLSEEEMGRVLGRIRGTTTMQPFADCDLVIECVPEEMARKRSVFAELDAACPPGVLLATNTSALSVLDIAMATRTPERVLGIHVALLTPVMEVVRTVRTGEETVQLARAFGEMIGKYTIVVKDSPGFISNRLLMPLILDAIRMLESGVATRDEIDITFTRGKGWGMGPLALADSGGLDSLLAIANALHENLYEPRFAAPVLLKKMVAAGWLGVKSGKGFYEYPA